MTPREPIALVLAGGGIRGAYEAGVLSALAPELDRRGERINIIVGTSIGSWNGGFLASQAHRPLAQAAAELVDVWRKIRFRDLLDPLTSPRSLARTARYFLLAGLPLRSGLRPSRSILRSTPLGPTLRRLIDFDQLARNVDPQTGPLAAAAFVATSYATTRSVVFHAGRAKPQPSAEPIDYIETSLTDAHLRASSAIQAILPPVNVPGADGAAHWYGDGGARLNSPLEPALALGARSVIAIGLNSGVTSSADIAECEPDFLDGAAQMMQTALADQLARDVARLASTNKQLVGSNDAGAIPYIFVSPKDRFVIGRSAREVYNQLYAGFAGLRRDPDVAILGQIADAGRSVVHAELYSYLFTSKEFVEKLIALGRADAEDWLSSAHDDGPWQGVAAGGITADLK
jgi:NTE family protein